MDGVSFFPCNSLCAPLSWQNCQRPGGNGVKRNVKGKGEMKAEWRGVGMVYLGKGIPVVLQVCILSIPIAHKVLRVLSHGIASYFGHKWN